MKRLLALALLVTAVVLTVAVMSGGAGTGGGKRVHVVEHATTDATSDIGDPGDSAGDVLTFANEVFDATNTSVVGHDQGYCIRIQAPPAADKWEKDIAALEKKPNVGDIVFIGSSTIRLWDVEKHLPGLKINNRGFGGSEIADSVRYADRILLPLKPKTVLLFAGGNDKLRTSPTFPLPAAARILSTSLFALSSSTFK